MDEVQVRYLAALREAVEHLAEVTGAPVREVAAVASRWARESADALEARESLPALMVGLLERDDELWVDELDALILWREGRARPLPLLEALRRVTGRFPREASVAALL